MPDSRTVMIYFADGYTAPSAQVSVEIADPDDEGDMRLEIFKGEQSKFLCFGDPACMRALARAILEAAQ